MVLSLAFRSVPCVVTLRFGSHTQTGILVRQFGLQLGGHDCLGRMKYFTHCGRLTWNRYSFRGWPNILDNVLLQMTSILLSGCLWGVRTRTWRISIFLLYEYVKPFIKNQPEVKPHKKSYPDQKWRALGLWLAISLHRVTSERFQMIWLCLLPPLCLRFLPCSRTHWLLLFQTWLLCTDCFCSCFRSFTRFAMSDQPLTSDLSLSWCATFSKRTLPFPGEIHCLLYFPVSYHHMLLLCSFHVII